MSAPDPVDASHRPLDDPPIAMGIDLSQVRNRVYGSGAGSTLAEAAPVASTSIPLATAAGFAAGGGTAMAAGQVVTYTGVDAGGVETTTLGANVSGPTGAAAPAVGGAMVAGLYFWSTTLVDQAGAESAVQSTGSTTVGSGGTNALALTNGGLSAAWRGVRYYRSKVGTSTPRYRIAQVDGGGATALATGGDDSLSELEPADSHLATPVGSTTLSLASVAGLPASGWVQSGQVAVQYAAISGATLTGIPATGPGGVSVPIPYGSAVRSLPALRGVSGVVRALALGEAINCWVVRNDLASQALLATRDDSDGVYEYLVNDTSLDVAALIVRCDAELTLYALPAVTVRYGTRDPKTRPGRDVSINIASPAIVATLTIQDVAASEFGLRTTLPKLVVTASSLRFTLEDLLAQLEARTAAG